MNIRGTMSHIKNVGMLILMQSDIAKAVQHYQKLGLKLIFHLKDKWAEFELGTTKIGLCPTSNPQEGHTGIVLEVDDLNAAYNAFKQEGITFINEPIEAVHGIMVSMKDPGGNIIDLYQPTPEKVIALAQKKAQEGCCGGDGPSCACKKTGKA